jgi:hypothetical protein
MVMDYLKLIKAQETKAAYAYSNTKEKFHGTDSDICFNEVCGLNNLTSHIL